MRPFVFACLLACGATTGLEEGAPPPSAPPDASPASTPPKPEKVAPMCEARPMGTFSADPAFGFAPGTELELYFDKRYYAEPDTFGVFFRLVFREPPAPGKDKYGSYGARRMTTISVPLDATWPTVGFGAYAVDASTYEATELCYKDGIGSRTQHGTLNEKGLLIIDEPGAIDEASGSIELGGGRRITFKTPVLFPKQIDIDPRCCRE